MEIDQKNDNEYNDLGLIIIGIAMFMFIAPMITMLLFKVGLGDVPNMIFKIGMWSIAFSFILGAIGVVFGTKWASSDIDKSTR